MAHLGVAISAESPEQMPGDDVKRWVQQALRGVGVETSFHPGVSLPQRDSWREGDLLDQLSQARNQRPPTPWAAHLFLVGRVVHHGAQLFGLMLDRQLKGGYREAAVVATATTRAAAGGDPSLQQLLLAREIAHELGHCLNLTHRHQGNTIMVPARRISGFPSGVRLNFAPGHGPQKPATQTKFVGDASDGPVRATLALGAPASALPGEPWHLDVRLTAAAPLQAPRQLFLGSNCAVTVAGRTVGARVVACGVPSAQLAAGESRTYRIGLPGTCGGRPLLPQAGQTRVTASLQLPDGGQAAGHTTLLARYPTTARELEDVRWLIASGASRVTGDVSAWRGRRFRTFLARNPQRFEGLHDAVARRGD